MLGVAGNIRVKILDGEHEANTWLKNNPDVEIIDIKFSSSATDGEWFCDVLVIYCFEGGRKNG